MTALYILVGVVLAGVFGWIAGDVHGYAKAWKDALEAFDPKPGRKSKRRGQS